MWVSTWGCPEEGNETNSQSGDQLRQKLMLSLKSEYAEPDSP